MNAKIHTITIDVPPLSPLSLRTSFFLYFVFLLCVCSSFRFSLLFSVFPPPSRNLTWCNHMCLYTYLAQPEVCWCLGRHMPMHMCMRVYLCILYIFYFRLLISICSVGQKRRNPMLAKCRVGGARTTYTTFPNAHTYTHTEKVRDRASCGVCGSTLGSCVSSVPPPPAYRSREYLAISREIWQGRGGEREESCDI